MLASYGGSFAGPEGVLISDKLRVLSGAAYVGLDVAELFAARRGMWGVGHGASIYKSDFSSLVKLAIYLLDHPQDLEF